MKYVMASLSNLYVEYAEITNSVIHIKSLTHQSFNGPACIHTSRHSSLHMPYLIWFKAIFYYSICRFLAKNRDGLFALQLPDCGSDLASRSVLPNTMQHVGHI